MDPFSLTTGIAGLLTLAVQVGSSLQGYISAVKEHEQDIAELRTEISLLAEVLSKVQKTAQDDVLEKDSVMSKTIVDCRKRLEKVAEKIVLPTGNKIARVIAKLRWPFTQSDVKTLVESVQRYISTFTFALTTKGLHILTKNSENATTMLQEMHDMSLKMTNMCQQMELPSYEHIRMTTQLGAILGLLPTLEQQSLDIKDINQHLRLAEERQQAKYKSEVLEWLAPASLLQKHGEVQKQRLANTCEWFLRSTQHDEWQDLSKAAFDFVCVGDPGTGKSTIASLVYDNLRERYKAQDVTILHHYCSHFDERSQSPTQLLRSILRQTCQPLTQIPSHVAKFHRATEHQVEDVQWCQELQEIVKETIGDCGPVFLIIDAIDEVENPHQRRAILQVLGILRSSNSSVRALVTARPHVPDLHNHLVTPAILEVSAASSDIRSLVAARLREHPDFEVIFDAELQRTIELKLSGDSHGTFLLPTLQLDHILQQITKAGVRRALDSLSRTVEEAFRTSLDRIRGLPGPRRDIAFQAMLWISHAKRVLHIDELRHALAVQIGEEDFNEDYLVPGRIIIQSCSGLVRLDQDTGSVSFVHLRLDEYLKNSAHELFEQAELTIVRTCLTYLSYQSLQPLVHLSREHFANAIVRLPLLRYAVQEWGLHARQLDVELYSELATTILTSLRRLIVMCRVRDFESPALAQYYSRMTGWATSLDASLSVAISFGLHDLVGKLLLHGDTRDLNTKHDLHGNLPLHEAASRGFTNICKLLISSGARITDLTRVTKATAFYQAVTFDQLETAQALLPYSRVQLDLANARGWTPLHKAADLGLVNMTQFLITAGSLVTAKAAKQVTPLHLASRKGHREVVELLIAANVDVNVPSKDGTALDLSTTGGYVEINRLLIAAGADIDGAGKYEWPPLLRACRAGQSGTVELLLSHGTNPERRDFRKNTCLHVAVRSGNLDIVKMLLSQNSDRRLHMLSQKDGKNAVPSQVALFTSNFGIYKYLRCVEKELSMSNDVHTNTIAISTAIETGNIEEVQRALKEDPMCIETPNEIHQLPLHIAFMEDQHDIAAFLLAEGASIHALGYHGWQPLHIAASIGSLKLVNLALASNADINAKTQTSQTPLHKACSADSVEVLRRLLEAGADPRARNRDLMTPLHIAAHSNFMDGAEELLQPEWNARHLVHAADKFGFTPRQSASRRIHLEMCIFLKLQERTTPRNTFPIDQPLVTRQPSRSSTGNIGLMKSVSESNTSNMQSDVNHGTRSSFSSMTSQAERVAQLLLDENSD